MLRGVRGYDEAQFELHVRYVEGTDWARQGVRKWVFTCTLSPIPDIMYLYVFLMYSTVGFAHDYEQPELFYASAT